MADSSISALAAAAALSGTEVVPIDQGGTTVHTTTQDIADLFVDASNLTSGTLPAARLPALSGDVSSSAGSASVTVTGVSKGNLLINGGFDVWQAGTSFTPSAGTRTRTADTWWALRNTHANYTVTRQTGVNNRYCIRVQRTSTTTDTDVIKLAVSLETQDVAWMATALQTMCVSFYARAGANYSAASSNLVAKVIRGTGTDENELDGYTGSSTLNTLTQPITTTMTRYSFTFTPDASTNELAIEFSFTPVGTAGASDYFELGCVQLEAGSTASAFQRRPFAQTFANCLRYYEKSFNYDVTPAQNVTGTNIIWLAGKAGNVSQVSSSLSFQGRKRVAPTVTLFNPFATNAEVRNTVTGTDCSGSTPGVAQNGWSITATTPTSTAVGDTLRFQYTAADPNF